MGLLAAVHARDLYKQGLMHPDERVDVVTAKLMFAENVQDPAAPTSDGKPGTTVTMCYSPRSLLIWGLRLKGPGYDIRQLSDTRRFGNGEVEFVVTDRGRPLRRYGLRFAGESAATEAIERVTRLRDRLAAITELTGVDDDGLGRAEWAMVDDVVTAAASPRVKAFGQAMAAWVDKDVNYKRQALYTYLLMRAACATVVGDAPTSTELRELADDISDRCVSRTSVVDGDMLYGNLLVAFDLTDDGSAVGGPQANVARMLIVGSVLTHPSEQLNDLRLPVARWVQGHPDFVRDSGF